MRRRDFNPGISVAASPLAVRAQQRTLPVIGFLNSGLPGAAAHFAGAEQPGNGVSQV
jgi:hypothetical protein